MNKRIEEVSYRPFDPEPVLQRQILPLERDDGSMLRRVAAGLARVADTLYERGAREAAIAGERDADAAVMASAPGASEITGGEIEPTPEEQKGYRVTVAPEGIRGLITEAARRNGVDPDALIEVARIESNFDPGARNPRSTAGGLFQFIDGTARQYGLRNKFDPAQASEAAARLMSDNKRFLEGRLGRSVTAGELYLAHQQGPEGARRLLANPDARAIDIVGRDAVLLNGGTADMTAGQFASLWTSKVYDGGARMKPEDADGPIKVTPVRTPLSIRTRPGRWRPTGSNTIYGRAYDVQGMKTYLQMAKMAIIEDQAAVYDRYKDDPAQLKAAMDELLEAHRRDGNYFPEIAPEYELSFRQNAFGLIQQAQANAETLRLQQDQVGFLDRVSALEDRKSQMLVGIDPANPSAATMLDDLQGTIDSHYDSAVSRGIMDPLEAARAKRESRSAMTVGYYLKQANGLGSDGLETLSAKMAEDYEAGRLKGVTAEDWGKIAAGLRAAISARRAEDDKVTADLVKRGDDIYQRALRGEPVAPSEIAKLRTDARLAPDGDRTLASTEAKMRLAAALRTQPVGTVEKTLGEILKRPDGKADPEDVDFARGEIRKLRERLVKDPLGAAESMGLVPPVPPVTLDGMKDPAALRDALSARWGSAVAAARHFGVPIRFFRPGEADQLQAMAMQDPDAMVAFTLNVANTFGKDTPAAMREIAEEGPVMAHAVGLSIVTGDASLARDVAKISVMKARKELDVKVPADVLNVKAAETLAGALMAQPETQNAAIGTAKLLFEKMAAEQGFDPATVREPDSVAAAAWEKALDRALGGQVLNGEAYGGLGMVNDRAIVVPPFMKKDQVENVLYGLTEKQLEKLPPRGTINGITVTATQMKDGYLVSIGDGLYRVALNDPLGDDPAYVIDKDGKPWVLDIRALEKIQKESTPEDYQPYRPGALSNPGQN